MSEDNKNINSAEETVEVETENTPETEVCESNAAKRLRMLGISVEEEPPKEPVKKTGFFENFWYHYKFHT